jgi:hypothetical protein
LAGGVRKPLLAGKALELRAKYGQEPDYDYDD